MMFDWTLFILVILADLAVEMPLLVILILAVNPNLSAKKVKEKLTEDDEFRSDLIQMITEDLFKPMDWKNDKGEMVKVAPIELASNHVITGMKQWINGKQSEMTQELEKNASEAMQISPENPMQAFILQQIPKKYRPYIQLAANLLLQNQNQ